MEMLALAVVAFVLTHELLSHPLRAPIVGAIGERGFMALYSVVALATLVWAVRAFNDAPVVPLWTAPEWAWHVGQLLMLFASVLLVGSLVQPNPSLPGMGAAAAQPPRGVQCITRHPMMWAVAIWAAVHTLVAGTQATAILASGIGFLALFGAAMQDRKKRAQLGAAWETRLAQTGFVPFAAQMSGRQRWSSAWPGFLPVAGGAALFALATGLHPWLFGVELFGR